MKALVLSGGSNKGAAQAGALKYLIKELNVKYDIFSGVSVGALACGFLAQYQEGQEHQSIDDLVNLWDTIDNSKIYKSWFPLGLVHAIWKKSLYDSSPLRKLIKDNISLDKIRKSGKQIAVGTVSINSGKYTTFDQTSDYLIEAIMGSGSFPGVMEPIEFMGQLWTDGGAKQLSPIQTAIDLGATEIDLIMTSPETRVKFFKENPNIIDIIIRAMDLATDKIMSNDVEKVLNYNKLAEFGYQGKKKIKLNVIRPRFNLTEDLFDFRQSNIQRMMSIGWQDAKDQYII